MTWSALRDLIASGRGQGHGDQYKPWIWIRRRNPSPSSNQVVARLPGFKRRSDFFARSEWHLALACSWLGAKDVREQLSLWPWPHQNPLTGAAGAQVLRLGESRGSLEIAKEAGIDHGHYVGTSIPYVASMDLCVTVERDGIPTLCFFPLKPEEHIVLAESEDRILAILELGRRYAAELGYPHRIGHENVLTADFRGNLEWFSSGAVLPAHLAQDRLINAFADRFAKVSEHDSVSRAIVAAAEPHKLGVDDRNLLFRHVVWHRLVDIDISRPLVLSNPAVPGLGRLVKAMQTELFGGAL